MRAQSLCRSRVWNVHNTVRGGIRKFNAHRSTCRPQVPSVVVSSQVGDAEGFCGLSRSLSVLIYYY